MWPYFVFENIELVVTALMIVESSIMFFCFPALAIHFIEYDICEHMFFFIRLCEGGELLDKILSRYSSFPE